MGRMAQESSQQSGYAGPHGYVTLRTAECGGIRGLVLRYANPDPRKLHAIDEQGMIEMFAALEKIECLAGEGGAEFLVFHGTCDPVHAGADITQFAGNPDYVVIRGHLQRGTELDIRLKALWPRLRTVAVFNGDRYGGSVEWPLFCEYGVADVRTRIQFSEVHLGIIPGWNGVLNVLLKSGAQNAVYMGATGNPVSAAQMLQMGLVQRVVETPPPPQKNEVPAEQWPALWAQYCADCEGKLLEAALELAAGNEAPAPRSGFELASEGALAEEIERRTDAQAYRALSEGIAAELAAADPADPEVPKTLAKKAAVEVAKLGKPLAPQAVEAVRGFVDRWAGMPEGELLRRFAEAAREEAELCCALMPTQHRRLGVNAVLSKNPAERVAVFD